MHSLRVQIFQKSSQTRDHLLQTIHVILFVLDNFLANERFFKYDITQNSSQFLFIPTQSTTCLSSNIKTFLLERETAMNIPPRDAISRGCIDNIAAGIFCCQSSFPFVDIQDNFSSIEATRIVFSCRTMPTVKLSRFTRIFAVELPRFNEQILPLRQEATILYKEKMRLTVMMYLIGAQGI